MANPLSSGASSALPHDAYEFGSLVVSVSNGASFSFPISAPQGWLVTVTGLEAVFLPPGGSPGWLQVGFGDVSDYFYVWTPGGGNATADYWRGALTGVPGPFLNFLSVAGSFTVIISGYLRPSPFRPIP